MQGRIDTTFGTYQRDLFESGLVAEIGPNAFAVWCLIKSHSDWNTGTCFPSFRRLMERTGLASATVQKAVACLEAAHLLRSERRGQRRYYVARERLDVKLGDRTLCSIVIDYVPNRLRERLGRIKAALETGENDPDAFAHVEIIPGKGFMWDSNAGALRTAIHVADFPQAAEPPPEKPFSPLAARVAEMGERAMGRRERKTVNGQKELT
ncbi:helix-turn-helix domain protein [Burkholderia pseudomallei MSHR7498]|uniref:helix-turn-helix domain-containing protein n=1 Tax=Burkholderia pseudomallei TaxID=28450 RepID=UPI00050EDF95|nr:helix-turn-helix domain-containing protein [Burkholderia pseudomallei]KGC59674.1 helix-turn-helix domain protein [Burkholderia pseudomallei]KGS84623.1 helix-turn-helix domain protein [Burkholderia pseudomallei MSHR5596]KGS91873.1 helix-turn-helix domain protein [Burkholderia pseudomallei MSHR7498]KGU63460.1 helix-turn-helix domain protein [Burkholderia pseudomallei MSHR983]